MSKTVNKLRKLEKDAFKQWTAAANQVHEIRNAKTPEKRSLLEMAAAAADAAFNRWRTCCELLDEHEAEHAPELYRATA